MKNRNTRRGFTQSCSLLHLREKVAEGRMRGNLAAFTLIELLVVVLIIGVLTAVAVSQYQKAVYKSRFTAMMPIAKTIANANEVYYTENGQYASTQAQLSVNAQENAEDGTEITLYSNPEELSFVLAHNDNIPNIRYVVYQKFSANFPDTAWCEAGDEKAEDLCVALGGVLPGGVTGNSSGQEDNWKAYLLSGQAQAGDSFAGTGGGDDNNEEDDGEAPVTTQAKLEALSATKCPAGGNYECHINSNGTLSVCDKTQGGYLGANGVCESDGTVGSFEEIYDEDNNLAGYYFCNHQNADGICQIMSYDNYGGTGFTRRCLYNESASKEGICASGYYAVAYDRTFDSKGNALTSHTCDVSTQLVNGKCENYTTMTSYDYTYHENGTLNNRLTNTCVNKSSPTTCSTYKPRFSQVTDLAGNTTYVGCYGTLLPNGKCSESWKYGPNRLDCPSGSDVSGVDFATGTCS